MSAYRYECDFCEMPLASAQVKRCLLCAEMRLPVFVGYCCLGKHVAKSHPFQNAEGAFCDADKPVGVAVRGPKGVEEPKRVNKEETKPAPPPPPSATVSELRIKRDSPHAILPKRATPGSAGFDLASVDELLIEPHSDVTINTGLVLVSFPAGCYGRIAPRSGLAKRGITVDAGVIDPDYRGLIKVLLVNRSDRQLAVKQGDRVAQLILERYDSEATVREVDEVGATARGEKGFGSTGV